MSECDFCHPENYCKFEEDCKFRGENRTCEAKPEDLMELCPDCYETEETCVCGYFSFKGEPMRE